jgi:hypothetical protein
MLYVMLQQLAIDDDELGLLVCGMGVQFAGEAAWFALLALDGWRATLRTRCFRAFLNADLHAGNAVDSGSMPSVKTPETVSVPYRRWGQSGGLGRGGG